MTTAISFPSEASTPILLQITKRSAILSCESDDNRVQTASHKSSAGSSYLWNYGFLNGSLDMAYTCWRWQNTVTWLLHFFLHPGLFSPSLPPFILPSFVPNFLLFSYSSSSPTFLIFLFLLFCASCSSLDNSLHPRSPLYPSVLWSLFFLAYFPKAGLRDLHVCLLWTPASRPY
jgi:hypothetical protein